MDRSGKSTSFWYSSARWRMFLGRTVMSCIAVPISVLEESAKVTLKIPWQMRLSIAMMCFGWGPLQIKIPSKSISDKASHRWRYAWSGESCWLVIYTLWWRNISLILPAAQRKKCWGSSSGQQFDGWNPALGISFGSPDRGVGLTAWLYLCFQPSPYWSSIRPNTG